MKRKRIWNNKVYLKKAILIKWEIWDFKMRIKCYFGELNILKEILKRVWVRNEFINIHEHLEFFLEIL